MKNLKSGDIVIFKDWLGIYLNSMSIYWYEKYGQWSISKNYSPFNLDYRFIVF